MRQYPEKDDADDLAILNAEQWQIDLLKLNPSYVWWGNYEDYMWKDGGGWDSAQEIDTFSEVWQLDELNECVNFYFTVNRSSHECPHCEGTALNPATYRLERDWYNHSSVTGKGWSDALTDIEVQALVDAGRLMDFTHKFVKGSGWVLKNPPYVPTVEEVNNWSHEGFGHDAINQAICVRARAQHLGIYGACEHCIHGQIYDEPTAHVSLQLWMIHPRKGCSRGLFVKRINQDDLPAIMTWLKTAASRNAERFSRITEAK
jgi:hypothetical protein